MTRPTVVCVGECLLELRPTGSATYSLGVAGDTYNAAVYLRRVARLLDLDVTVGYLTGVGDDTFSARMRHSWAEEEVDDLAVVVPGGRPGIYAIENRADGERSFTHWREESAARSALHDGHWARDLEGDVVYLSGITLQLLSPDGLAGLREQLRRLRAIRGCLVAFDTNYRPGGWVSRAVAAAVMDDFLAVVDVAFTSLEDERALGGVTTPEAAAGRLAARGPREVVVKDGPNGVWFRGDAGRTVHLDAVPVTAVVDTTGAGDALAGTYLAARLAGLGLEAAARLGTEVASVVVAHPGAIVPRDVPLTR